MTCPICGKPRGKGLDHSACAEQAAWEEAHARTVGAIHGRAQFTAVQGRKARMHRTATTVASAERRNAAQLLTPADRREPLLHTRHAAHQSDLFADPLEECAISEFDYLLEKDDE